MARTVGFTFFFFTTPDAEMQESRDWKQSIVLLLEGAKAGEEFHNVVVWALGQGMQRGAREIEIDGTHIRRHLFMLNFFAAEYQNGRAELQFGLRLTVIPELAGRSLDGEKILHLNIRTQYDFALIKFMCGKRGHQDEVKWQSWLSEWNSKNDMWAQMTQHGSPVWQNGTAKFLWPADAAELAAAVKNDVQVQMPDIRSRAIRLAATIIAEECKDYQRFKAAILRLWNLMQDIISCNKVLALTQERMQYDMEVH